MQAFWSRRVSEAALSMLWGSAERPSPRTSVVSRGCCSVENLLGSYVPRPGFKLCSVMEQPTQWNFHGGSWKNGFTMLGNMGNRNVGDLENEVKLGAAGFHYGQSLVGSMAGSASNSC